MKNASIPYEFYSILYEFVRNLYGIQETFSIDIVLSYINYIQMKLTGWACQFADWIMVLSAWLNFKAKNNCFKLFFIKYETNVTL